MLGISETCRLCMKKYGSDSLMENIFCGGPVTVDNIKLVTQIDVAKGDGLPEYVCISCIFALNIAKNFIQECIRSNEKLKLQARVRASQLQKTDILKETFLPVAMPLYDFPRQPKIEPCTPNGTECVARRLILWTNAQGNADEEFLTMEPKKEIDILDETGTADISRPELNTGYDVQEQEQKTVQLTLSPAPGSSVLNPEDVQGPQESEPKGDFCTQPQSPNTPKKIAGLIPENEPILDESAMVLSWFDSDLNLVIDKVDFLSAAPVHIFAFGYMWAGARATFGFNYGKLAFQTKVEESLDVSHLGKEPCPNALRVGWSVPSASLQLGEMPSSYGFCSTGKAFTNCTFKDYGVIFKVGDIVTSYLEWTNEDAVLSFAVNGKTHGEAFRVPREKLDGQPLFPHILSKNRCFSVDFGAREEPWLPLDNGFVFVGAAPVASRVAGPRRPEKKEDCEMVMVCGLPGAGKTTWVNQYVARVPEKRFNVLGTNALIGKMRVDGLPRKRNCEGRWEQLIEKSTHCLIKLMEVAAGRCRNYILDQGNVYPEGQRRKMRGFEGFARRAVVIVPTDGEFKGRLAKRQTLEGKYLSDADVLEMKANFGLPEEGDVFSSVTFVELERKEAQELVGQYNKEGQAASHRKNKRPCLHNSSSLDGSFREQSRKSRIKWGRDNTSRRSRGGGRHPRGSSRGSRRGHNHYSCTSGGSGGNPGASSCNHQGLQASSVGIQHTTGYNWGDGGNWSTNQVWMQPQQLGGNFGNHPWNNYSQNGWNNFNQNAWSNYGQQGGGSSLGGRHGQQRP